MKPTDKATERNGIGLQKLRILARLTEGPATCEQLQTQCQSPDPRARIHELRTDGHTITTHHLHRVNPDGSVNRVGLYDLQVKVNGFATVIGAPIPLRGGVGRVNKNTMLVRVREYLKAHIRGRFAMWPGCTKGRDSLDNKQDAQQTGAK